MRCGHRRIARLRPSLPTGWSFLLTLPALVLAATPLQAQLQSVDWPDPGDRVRVSSPDASGEFVVTGLLADALVLQDETVSSELAVEMSSFFGLEVYEGRRSRLWGGVFGSIAGGAAGLALSAPCELPHMSCDGIPPSERILAGAGLGMIVGLALWGGREIWEEVRLPDRAGPVLAQSGGARGGFGEPPSEGGNRNVLTSAEIRQAEGRYGTAWELVRGLRSGWLTPRAVSTLGRSAAGSERVSPGVVLDGAPYGEIRALEDFILDSVERLEYLEPSVATIRYGPDFEGGAILVELR